MRKKTALILDCILWAIAFVPYAAAESLYIYSARQCDTCSLHVSYGESLPFMIGIGSLWLIPCAASIVLLRIRLYGWSVVAASIPTAIALLYVTYDFLMRMMQSA